MNPSVSFTLFLALACAAPVFTQSRPDPTIVDRYVELTGWWIGVDYSPSQRAELRAMVEGYWIRNDRKAIAVVEQCANQLWPQLRQAQPDVREATLVTTRPDLLVNLQKDSGADSRWLFEQYLKAHPSLAPGKPGSVPLSRQMVDAALDLEEFIQGEVLRKRPASHAAGRAFAYQAAARAYSSLTVEQQLDVARKPGQLAMERGQWNRMGPQLRAMVRAAMGGNLSPEDQQLVAEFQNMGRNHANAVLGAELSSMRQNSDLIMGRGTTWNSTLGRWEQHGGIKTEFDSGTVRVP